MTELERPFHCADCGLRMESAWRLGSDGRIYCSEQCEWINKHAQRWGNLYAKKEIPFDRKVRDDAG